MAGCIARNTKNQFPSLTLQREYYKYGRNVNQLYRNHIVIVYLSNRFQIVYENIAIFKNKVLLM